MQKANRAAKNLNMFLGRIGDEEMTFCYYKSNSNVVGVAITLAVPYQELHKKEGIVNEIKFGWQTRLTDSSVN